MTNIKINTTVIFMSIIVLTAISTWIVPAGQYDREIVDGRQTLVEGSFHHIESSPQGIFDVLQAPMRAFGRSTATGIMAFLLIIGGAFMIIERTGALTAAIKHASVLFTKRPKLRVLFIPVSMLLFSLGGATYGMAEEVLIFVPVFIPLAISLRYDSTVGVAVPFLGAYAGFGGAFMNPFTLGVAQGIAELPLYSGMGYRLIIWASITAVAIIFVMLYARKITKNPSASLTYEFDKERKEQLRLTDTIDEKFTIRHKLVLGAFASTIVLLIFGVIRYEWHIVEIGALFLGLGVVATILGRMKINDATKSFYDGVRSMAEIIFLLALATSIIIIAENGNILDTILHFMASGLSSLNATLASWVAFIMQAFLNLFIPGGSSKAILTMPILAPLSDLIGITRQTMILAYQFGDGIGNLFMPTNVILLGVISMARIPFAKWFRFIMPLVVVWALMSLAFLAIAVQMNWQ